MNPSIKSSYGLSDLSSKGSPFAAAGGWRIGVAVALLSHIGLLYGLQAALRRPPVLRGDTAIEINTIAAPAESAGEASTAEASLAAASASDVPAPIEPLPVEPAVELLPELAPEPELEPSLVTTEPDPLPRPAAEARPVEAPVEAASSPAPCVQQVVLAAAPSPAAGTNAFVGDGSSATPALEATSAPAQPGIRARPNYLRNPEPPYPAVARRRRQQGTVLLAVSVSAAGRATRVGLKQTSGHPALDAAALGAVGEWDFEPARNGATKVDSEIEVPVRFRLTK
jgi:protein TonB